jgi:signal transduction histidine kinase
MQIRTRLTIQFIILVAGILLSALYFIYFEFYKMTEDEFYGSLRSKALMTAEMVLHDEDQLTILDERDEKDNIDALPFKDNVLIFNKNWQKIFAFDRSEGQYGKNFFENQKKQEIKSKEGNDYIVGIRFVSKKGNPYYIVAKSKFNVYQVNNLKSILIWTFCIIIVLVAIGGWFYTGQAIAPVAKIVKQVDGILPTNLNNRLTPTNSNDEIGRLVATFNNLLDRIYKSFTLQKHFISNVSHELKNPIAVISSQIEVSLAKKDRTKEEYEQTLQSVSSDMRELSDTIENLLQLARLHNEEHQQPQMQTLRLDEILWASRERIMRLHHNYKVNFDIVGTPENEVDFYIKGNESLLRSAFNNLMDNACKYSRDKSVEVRLIIAPNKIKKVEIEDKGEGLGKDDIEAIFKPFYRNAKHKHIKGTGIGLSLVDSILKLHQIPLTIESHEGKGTVFSLEFSALNYIRE